MADLSNNLLNARGRFPGSFPRLYPWLFLLAALDLGVTSIILALGGHEVNAVADQALQAWGILGLLLVKAASLLVLVGCCEAIVRVGMSRGRRVGAGVAAVAVATTCVPVAYGSAQLGQALLIERDPLMWEAIVLSQPLDQVVQRHGYLADQQAQQLIRRRRQEAEANRDTAPVAGLVAPLRSGLAAPAAAVSAVAD